MPRILIITGEASGDLHGANLAIAIKALSPDAALVGVGGARMQAAGVNVVEGIGHLDIIGLIGPSAVRAVVHRLKTVRRLLQTEAWDAVVLIDNPGLNFHFARIAKKAGHRVVYYIAPQLWAWRPGRMRWMQRRVDHVIVTLPFEEPLYRAAGVPCTFVGHPLLDAVEPCYDRVELRKQFGLESSAPVIGLLPGSRVGEVQLILPVLLQTMARLARLYPGLQVIMAQAGTIQDSLVNQLLASSPVNIRVVKHQPNEVMAAADVLLIASGTATLQAALVGTPMIIVYRAPKLTFWLARQLVRVKWIGLANLIAGRSIVPEVLQDEVTPERLTEEASHLLRDRTAYRQMQKALEEVRASLGEPGASQRAAAVVLAECRT
ncbi:MAG TPA: lipid-A-disaccharide synthase [Nitrospiraceae bacterium]|nr:lipid-A-disaccharide synthase [Nitrospiraceae bacterium]